MKVVKLQGGVQTEVSLSTLESELRNADPVGKESSTIAMTGFRKGVVGLSSLSIGELDRIVDKAGKRLVIQIENK